MQKVHPKNPAFSYNAYSPLTKTKKTIENLGKLVIANMSTDTIYIKFVFSIIQHQEQLHIKSYIIKHLKQQN